MAPRAILGFFMGPIFPTTISVMSQLVAERLVPSAIGFLVGTLAQYLDLWVLLPYTLALTAAMYPNWAVMIRCYAPSR